MDVHFHPHLSAVALEKKKRADKKRPSDQRFKEALTEGTEATPLANSPQTVATQATAETTPLFAIQELTTREHLARHVRAHGTKMLDRLEQLRLSLLTQTLSPKDLEDLAHLVRQEASDQIEDPALKTVLQDIEVLAAVELAKRGRTF